MSMLGDNIDNANFFKDEIERMKSEYPHLEVLVAELEAEGDKITAVEDEATKGIVTSLIKRAREAYKRIQGVHEPEKAPHLERGRGVDSFCFGLMDRLGRRDKKAKPGMADRLNQLLTDYDVREEAARREKLRLEAEAAERKRKAAEAERIKAEQEAAAKAAEAERARKPETQAAKAEVASEAAAAASAARVEEIATTAKADDAYVQTLASSADLMRQRNDEGVLSTMATEKFIEIVDRNALDLNKLRPYLSVAELEKALRKYAESVSYSMEASAQIAGARFGKKPKSRVL